ncbi:hypothetical protein BH23CHL2_BH23CHL2_22380 [soil metagenome]
MHDERSSNRSYEERLRAIGGQLNRDGYHSITILEVDGGLVVRASAHGSRTPEVLEVVDDHRLHAVATPAEQNRVPHRLFPGGYTQFLTAFGQRLDSSRAAAIAIVEGTDFVTVGGIRPVAEGDDGVTYEPLDILLLADDIQAIVETMETRESPRPTPDASESIAPAEAPQRRKTGITDRLTSTIGSALRLSPVARHTTSGRG